MASTSSRRKYPPRLYEVGKSPIQGRKMNHNFHLKNMRLLQEAVGDDVWISLKESAVGVILKLMDVEYIWAAKVAHNMVTNQLYIVNPNEIWSIIEGQPIRFSLYEFAEITGLNCDPFSDATVDVDHKEFWAELNVPPSEGPKLKELEVMLPRVRNWRFNKQRMFGLLYVLSVGIYGISPGSRVPLSSAKLVLDMDAFEKHPWGRVAFTSLVNSIKVISYDGDTSYTLRGCVHVLLIWAYEFIPGLGKDYGNRIDGAEVPLLGWRGSQKRINYAHFYAQEKLHHHKVRVRHMVMKTLPERYPQWEIESDDQRLDNLIVDIINGKIDEEAWDDSEDGQPPKPGQSSQVKKIAKKPVKTKEAEPNVTLSGDPAFMGMLKLVKTLADQVNRIDEAVSGKVGYASEETIDAKVNARVNLLETALGAKIGSLEQEVKQLKEKVVYNAASVDEYPDNSKTPAADDVYSSTPSWIVKTKVISQDEEPINCVVKNGKKASNKGEDKQKQMLAPKVVNIVEDDAEMKTTMRQPTKLKGKGVKRAKPLNKIKKDVAPPLKKVKKEPDSPKKRKRTEMIIPHLIDESISGQTWSNEADRTRVHNLNKAIDALVAGVVTVDDPLPKRKPKLTKTQVYPYVGNSKVKRIIKDSDMSHAFYDPLAKVEESKFKKLMDFLKTEQEEPEGAINNSCQEFYVRLTLPRKDWPSEDYGWVTDSHLASAMYMLHKRSTRDLTPYKSERIAFLDQWFVSTWVRDYARYDPSTWECPDYYKKVFNGQYPEAFKTNKQWLKDVDYLYLCHNINGNHWVAIIIDLVKSKLHVYDSIPEVVPTSKRMLEECRVFTRMVPAILNVMVPPTVRKKSEKQLLLTRHKGIPENEDPGDCGIYAIKYLECKAIGCNFEGLNDDSMQPLRIKLAAEIYDEVVDI